MTPQEAATGLPGGYVRQNEKWDASKGDCFSACVSMLTGIDLELLPVHPPKLEVGSHDGEWFHVYATEGWQEWVALLADNGYSLKIVDDATTYIAGTCLPGYGAAHAMVVHEGLILNPAMDEVINVDECAWIIGIKATVTPL